MADEHDPQQLPSFHWPPTPEELDTIQVVDMQGRPLREPRRHWRVGVAKATMTQAGVLAASLAAIGIALTSMLATPAQPVGRAARAEAPAAVTAAAAAASVDDSAAFPADSTPAFVPMVTLEIEKSSAADIRKEPREPVRTARDETFGSWPPAEEQEHAPVTVVASTQSRPTRVARTAERRFAKRDAGRDPVSQFAVHTGKSVWKAMRAVGRSFKHQGDQEFFATRPAGGRRTAKAVGLQAESAPSDR